MSIFKFDDSHLLGKVREVDTRKVSILVEKNEDLRKARVSQLVALKLPGAVEAWLVGLIEKVIKSVSVYAEDDENNLEGESEGVVNTVKVTLLGSLYPALIGLTFSRSLTQVPDIDAPCYILRDAQLEAFMNVVSKSSKLENSFEVGKYTIDDSAKAYIDGNKFFQRHAAILGSTGSGKSWTVAAILEKAAKLKSSNLIVFDLHGEYKKLSYAKHLRIPGPEDLGKKKKDILFLPYWLLNSEEIQAMFIDRSEFSAHNQVMAFQDAVIEEKKEVLKKLKKDDVLAAFTIDSPVPFELENVLNTIKSLNEEMIEGSRGLKQGNFYGQFSRLLTRIRSRLSDKRYGFIFQAPNSEHQYQSMANLATNLMDFSQVKSQIKIIDFSEVPTDILPIIVGLVARIIYQVQFWTTRDERHPLVFVCDEAHLYLPKKEGQNPVERRAIESFEKIAKEGRKYGVALLIVSQRPSDVSDTILSQCNNIIALRLTNSEDQITVKKLLPESLESLMDTLPIMDIGEGMVVGDAVLLPSRIKLNEPEEKPLSSTIDIWSEWGELKHIPDFVKTIENFRKQSRD
ncbi:MAG: ATP-binding protein [Ignavibacteriales bacterium]|nr:ATP-binding protein [Ignavibacteriales bacterium]